MLVYRICKKEEVDYILNNHNFTIVGQNSRPYKANNHHYEPTFYYMHFFKEFDSIFYMLTKKGRCICTYDIPEDILKKYQGMGVYTDYIVFRHEEYVTEYAIKTTEMRVEYLKRVEVLLADIDYEDMLDGFLDSSLIETIYPNIIRVRKKEESIEN